MRKKYVVPIVALLILVVAYFIFSSSTSSENSDLIVEAKKGVFQIDITTSGELEAKSSVKIMGPNFMSAGMWQVKIDKLVDEGTRVKKGDFIATLDKSDLSSKMMNAETELQKSSSQFSQTQLDSALTLRQARDELLNLKYGVTEKEIVLEQSKFEPPATIKQAEIDLEKAQRAYLQAKENYKIKFEQSKAKMQEVAANLGKAQRELSTLQELIQAFTITAPEEGMVVYVRDWNGSRRTTGSQVNAWEPTVATLPDLTTMISKTYVNEVDIRKIAEGQKVFIGLDAFPEKKLTGKVINVSNVGEQKPNSDAKVYQVNVQIVESDTTLRPAMTTSNSIISEVIENVVYVPLECLHNQGDTLTFVYKRDGVLPVRQEVEIGKSNSNEIVVYRGVDEGDKLYLSVPKNADKSKLNLLEKVTATASSE
ncbi:MAG: efflux RND transporter periplasmic adaptor subunit [Bacteroidota bacterium]|jgi:multidrug efflux pump subunit AcrA (membrane-fusion protein)|nr:efflux RND transporter periplasmic adaptor subunit [Bacteroidota bacterium]